MAHFLIDGMTVIDLKISELIVLTFGLPPTTPSSFFTTNLVSNLASLLGVSVDQIRRVNIISANNDTRIRRQTAQTIQLRVEIRNDPPRNISQDNSVSSNNISNCNAQIINQYQAGILQTQFALLTGGIAPLSLSVQEPGNQTSVTLSVISRMSLLTPPSNCRAQSPCDTQPVLIAYDALGNIINKLGANDQPWTISASVVGQSGVVLFYPNASYANGQSQYQNFSLPTNGAYQVQFSFITPSGVPSSFVATVNLTVNSGTVTVTDAILSVKQVVDVNVVSVNETFNLTTSLVDAKSNFKIANISWSGLTWTASVTLYPSLEYQSNGSLVTTTSSSVIVDVTAGTISATNLAINATGMYIIKMIITSTNGPYSLPFTSNAILVKKNTTVLQTFDGEPPIVITFQGNYYAYQSNGTLEILRATIYNCLTQFLNWNLSTTVTLKSGSILAGVGTNLTGSSGASTASTGMTYMTQTNPGLISNLNVVQVSYNGLTYSARTTSTSDTDSGLSIGAIIGIVVGICGAVFIIVGIIFGYRRYRQNQAEPLVDESDEESSCDDHPGQTAVAPPKTTDNFPPSTKPKTAVSSYSHDFDQSRLHSPLGIGFTGKRALSATLSITTLSGITPDSKITPIELANFD